MVPKIRHPTEQPLVQLLPDVPVRRMGGSQYIWENGGTFTECINIMSPGKRCSIIPKGQYIRRREIWKRN
jgi:hypothetical protein